MMNRPVEPPSERVALVVEDNSLTRSLLCETLSSLDFQVQSAQTALDAIVILTGYEVDLAVVDLHLGDGPAGTAVLDVIRRQSPWTAVVVLSAYRNPRLLSARSHELPGAVYLRKSEIDGVQILTHAVDRAINGEVSDPRPNPSAAYIITPAQADVLRLIAAGLDNQEIGQELGLNLRAVEHAIRRLYRALRLNDTTSSGSRRVRAARIFDHGDIEVRTKPG